MLCQHISVEKVNKTAARFRAIREELGLTQQEMAERLLLSRNYIAQIETGLREPSIRVLNGIESLASGGVEKVKHQSTKAAGDAHLKTGGASTVGERKGPVEYGTVASRIGPSDSRLPTRADCELFIQQIFDAAQASGDPSAFPVLMHRLKKQFQLDEFERIDP